MKKYYVSGIIIIVLVVGVYVYFENGVTCYDGYGSGRYVTKSELTAKLNSAGSEPNDLSTMFHELDEIAIESYRCGDTSYSINDDDKFRKVSQSDFQKFVDGKSGLYKVTQSGNSPYFVEDLTTGNKYFIDQKNGKYILSVENY